MSALNSVMLEGTLTRDADYRELPGGTEVCRLCIGYRGYAGSGSRRVEESGCFDVEIPAAQAKACGDSLSRGQRVRVAGRLRQEPEGRVFLGADYIEMARGRREPEEAKPAAGMLL